MCSHKRTHLDLINIFVPPRSGGMEIYMKRITALILVLSLLLPALIACSGDGDIKNDNDGTANTTTAATTDPGDNSSQTDYFPDGLKELDYGGKTVNILTQNANSFEHRWIYNEICVEDLTGDPVNDALYYRNIAVEELLGVKIEQTVQNDEKKLREIVNSGDNSFDLIAAPSDEAIQFIPDGAVLDLYGNGIETYLDTESPWWSQLWIDEAEINGRLYAITGAASMSLSRFTMVMFYNKYLGNGFGYEDPYEVVNSGRWTIDYVNEIISGIYVDVDNDKTVNGNDRFGIGINADDNCDMFWSAFDMSFITKGDDGWYEINTADKEKISTAFDKIFALLNESPDALDTVSRVGLIDTRDYFSLGRLLLAPLHLKYAESQYFRYMDSEYAVLPLPKYDEAQDDYYSFVQEQYSIFMVPTTASDPEMSGALLEAMACESYNSVKPVYYDSVLKGKYTRDDQTKQIMDTIANNVKLGPAWIYGELWGRPEGAMFGDLIDEGDKNFEGGYAAQEKIMKILLKEFNGKLEAIAADS